jgi:hypothetical protein
MATRKKPDALIPHTFLISHALRDRLRRAKLVIRPETSEGAIVRDALDTWLTAHGLTDQKATKGRALKVVSRKASRR